MFFGLMVFIIIALFNSIRKTAVIWLTVPLAIVGVTAGLLLFSEPFGFMAMLLAQAFAARHLFGFVLVYVAGFAVEAAVLAAWHDSLRQVLMLVLAVKLAVLLAMAFLWARSSGEGRRRDSGAEVAA